MSDWLVEVLRSGGNPYACGCIGCRDRLTDGSCPCGKNCSCQCTLPSSIEKHEAFRKRVEAAQAQLDAELHSEVQK